MSRSTLSGANGTSQLNGRAEVLEASRLIDARPRKHKVDEVELVRLRKERMMVRILGTQPFIFHRLGVDLSLLGVGPDRNNEQYKKTHLKSDLVKEFKDSTIMLPEGDTLLVVEAKMLKACIRCAALDTEDTTKAEIGRLVYVPGDYMSIYGIPKMFIRNIRNSGMNRTPGVRSRAIMAEWGVEFPIEFSTPRISASKIFSLLANGGISNGIGDFRPQKGAGSYGQFEIYDDTNLEHKRRWENLVKTGSRQQQIKAMNLAEPYDVESTEFITAFMEGVKALGKEKLLDHTVIK
ncbi:MAG: hypothetical protein ACP5I8_13295 [Phycisphaerae bacterium]